MSQTPSSLLLSEFSRARAIVATRWVLVLYQLFAMNPRLLRSALRQKSLTVS